MTPEERRVRDERWDAFMAKVESGEIRIPSVFQMEADIAALQEAIARLTVRIEALERENTALRQEALVHFWQRED